MPGSGPPDIDAAAKDPKAWADEVGTLLGYTPLETDCLFGAAHTLSLQAAFIKEKDQERQNTIEQRDQEISRVVRDVRLKYKEKLDCFDREIKAAAKERERIAATLQATLEKIAQVRNRRLEKSLWDAGVPRRWKIIQPPEIRPRHDNGCDHGAEAIILLRRGRKVLLWQPGSTHWAGIGMVRRYSGATLELASLDEVFGKNIARGRLTRAALLRNIAAIRDFFDCEQIQDEWLSRQHTVLIPGSVPADTAGYPGK